MSIIEQYLSNSVYEPFALLIQKHNTFKTTQEFHDTLKKIAAKDKWFIDIDDTISVSQHNENTEIKSLYLNMARFVKHEQNYFLRTLFFDKIYNIPGKKEELLLNISIQKQKKYETYRYLFQDLENSQHVELNLNSDYNEVDLRKVYEPLISKELQVFHQLWQSIAHLNNSDISERMNQFFLFNKTLSKEEIDLFKVMHDISLEDYGDYNFFANCILEDGRKNNNYKPKNNGKLK